MRLEEHLSMLATYNRMANERLYAACALLEDAEYRQARSGSLGSIHALLNHLLLGDRIWMSRFAGGGQVTPALNTVLEERLADLRLARVAEDERIEAFFAALPEDFLRREFRYRNNRGLDTVETAGVAVSHFFNHQTHHRGQVHVMLSQTKVTPPSLDLHRMLNP